MDLKAGFTTGSTENLTDLIHRKHVVLTHLRDTGQQQIALVEKGDVTELLKLLATKQQLIAQLQTVERQLAPYRNEDPETRTWKSPAARAETSQQALQCNQLLREVLELEKQSENRMVSRRDDVATQLKAIHSSGEARGAYAAQQAYRTPPTPPTTVATEQGEGLDLCSDR